MKVLHFIQMMKSLGHTVYHYGAEGSDVECDEHITIITKAEQEKYFGVWDVNKLYNLGWKGTEPYWPLTNGRAAAAINQRKQPGDIVCVICGRLNQPLAQAAGGDVAVVEYGIGYTGTFSKYRVFESYSHMHMIWAAQGGFDPDGKFYDAVVPNYFNPADYWYGPIKDDYFLYMGRIMTRKGVEVAVEVSRRLGKKLILAGQGVKNVTGNRIECVAGEVYEGDHLEYVGCVVGEQKAKLLQRAQVAFTPTFYVEPFGGVAVEAQMAGTPVISTDFGAFTETVEHGRTGYRCHSLDQFVWAAQHVGDLDPWYIRQRAVANYGMDRVRWMYQEYFEMVVDLWKKGWYEMHPDRLNMDWLKRY
jgi:glycosyltransferase involved in cell wall biosynthesis